MLLGYFRDTLAYQVLLDISSPRKLAALVHVLNFSPSVKGERNC